MDFAPCRDGVSTVALRGPMAAVDQTRENGQAGSPAPTVAIDIARTSGSVLFVRLWTRQETGEPARAGGESVSPAVCLTLDILKASGAEPEMAADHVFVARYAALQAGVLAARRLQWAAQGFSESENPKETAIAAVVQHAGDSPEEASFPEVLQHAAPGQILLTDNVGNALEEMAGFSLGPSTSTGFRELIWRSQDQHSTRSTDEMVISWFIEQKGPEFYSEAFSETPAKTDSNSGDEATTGRRRRQGDAEESDEAPVPTSIHKSRAGLIWSLGIAGVVVLLLAGVLVFHPFNDNPVQKASSTPPIESASTHTPAGQSEPVQQAPVQSARIQVAPPARSLRFAPVPNPSNTVVHQPKQKIETEEPPKVEPPAKPAKQPDSRCDLDPSQYVGQIEQAEANMARGKYSAAQRQFESVLACEPGNARARGGLERVHHAQSAEGAPSQ